MSKALEAGTKARDLIIKHGDEIVKKMADKKIAEKAKAKQQRSDMKKEVKYLLELKEVEAALTIDE